MLKFTNFIQKANVLVNCTEHKHKDYQLTILDFDGTVETLTPSFNKGTLTKCIDINADFKSIYNEIIDNINSSSEEHLNISDPVISKHLIFYKNEIDLNKSSEENKTFLERKCVSRIYAASNFIATNGRIGPAQYFILNKKNKEYMRLLKNNFIRPIYDNYVKPDTILFGRKNPIDCPSLQFVYYIENGIVYYDIIKSGKQCFKQYLKIKIENL